MKIGNYKNGNYDVTIYDNGTKIRRWEGKWEGVRPLPEFPESIDLKITNCCDMACKFCHEDSRPDGEHGDILNLPFFLSMKPYTEVAIGGGNPLSHPDLLPFLEMLRRRCVIANMTVNQKHFLTRQSDLKFLCNEGLIHGLGVSYTDPGNYKGLVTALHHFPNAVVHCINGIVRLEDLYALSYEDLNLLILGYKTFRRGVQYYGNCADTTKRRARDLYEALPDIIDSGWFNVVSFDNLAIKQLDAKRFIRDDWQTFYMGSDGEFTMYIDAVKGEYAKSSVSSVRKPVTSDIVQMFAELHNTMSMTSCSTTVRFSQTNNNLERKGESK